MKKILLVVGFLMFALCLGGCVLFGGDTCEHEYQQTSLKEATCIDVGLKIETCNLCSKEKKTTLSALGHHYESSKVEPTCKDQGYTLRTCSNCGDSNKSDYTPLVEHTFGEWVVVKEATEVQDGQKQRECSECFEIETIYIASTSYIDLTIIKQEFNAETTYVCSNYKELSLMFQTAVVNMADKLVCNVNFDFGDISALLNTLVKDCENYFSFGVSLNQKGGALTFSFTYTVQPSNSTGDACYVQYDSLNEYKVVSTRPADFDEFKIYKSNYSFQVQKSDQLYYVLERGVKPICASGSSAERVFNQLKQILVNIVDDNMTDYQKVIAIHDYLVMNVTYDKVLYGMSGSSQSLKNYNGFYIEGVVFDKVAVCEGISKTLTALCNIEGIPCVTVSGYQTANPNGVGHAWNKVYIDGTWYIIDATSDGTIINDEFEVLSYKYCLITEDNFKNLYTGKNFTNILCSNDFNVYEYSSFTYKEEVYDLVISSQKELDVLIAYFEGIDKSNLTLEFKVDFEVGDSASDEVMRAYSNNRIYKSCRYIDNGDVFMLLK